MKRRVLFLATAILLSSGASAQLQFGLKAGYAMPAGSTPLGYSTDGNKTTTIYGTFGQGIPISLEMAYFFSDNIGIQLDATYLMGSEVTNSEVLTNGLSYSYVTKTTQIRVTPSLVFRTDLGLYSRFGAVLPLAGNTTATIDNANGGGSGVASKQVVVAKGKFGLGFNAALGYQLNLGDKLGIFGELEYIGLSVKRASTELTTYTVGGTDILPSLTDAQKNTTYEDETTAPSTIAQGSSSSYNSFGFNVGIRFRLGE